LCSILNIPRLRMVLTRRKSMRRDVTFSLSTLTLAGLLTSPAARAASYTFEVVEGPAGSSLTILSGTNNPGVITGYFLDASDPATAVFQSFVSDKGEATHFAVPGAASTIANDISNNGRIVGRYLDEQGIAHGFVFNHGSFSTIDIPGFPFSSLNGTNNRGD